MLSPANHYDVGHLRIVPGALAPLYSMTVDLADLLCTLACSCLLFYHVKSLVGLHAVILQSQACTLSWKASSDLIMGRLIAVAVLVLCIGAGMASASHIIMMDCSGRHLKAGGEDAVLLGPASAAGLTASLAGLLPPQSLDRDAAKQVRAAMAPRRRAGLSRRCLTLGLLCAP
jgi:hypothetical protein